MKRLIHKIFFRKNPPRPFYAVRISHGQIAENVFLINGDRRLDISERHNIVCQTPFSIAVWIARENLADFSAPEQTVVILRQNQMLAKLNLSFIMEESGSKGSFRVFRIGNVRCFGLNFLQRFLLFRYFFSNERLPKTEAAIYGALYSYPRKVIITSFRDGSYYNMFPMDFQCSYPEEGMYLLGLKKSNITLDRIISSGKVVISATEAIDSKTVYDLGAHHSKQPPALDSLPFSVGASKQFEFPVPDFTTSYIELSIVASRDLGSHTMLLGKQVNQVQLQPSACSLFHIHYIAFKTAHYKTV